MVYTKNITAANKVFAGFLGQLKANAVNHKKTAYCLYKINKPNHERSISMLLSLCFELFPKLLKGYLVCIRHKDNYGITIDEVRTEVINEMKSGGHDLAKIYNQDFFKQMRKEVGIVSVNKISDEFLNGYKIEVKERDNVFVCDFEAVRYAGLAKDREMITLPVSKNLFALLDQIEFFLVNKYKEVGGVTRSK